MRSQPRLGAHACPRTRELHRNFAGFKPLTCTFTLPAARAPRPAAGSRSPLGPLTPAAGRGPAEAPAPTLRWAAHGGQR